MTEAAVTGIPVCVFAKPPVPGRVKTRLASAVGDARAAGIAAAMLGDVWSVVNNTAGTFPVLAAAEPGAFALDVPEERIWLQPSGDLGLRIECILRRGLESASAAIALGADSPLLTTVQLSEAMDALQSGDAVLGPCSDGGFYLLGLRCCPPGLLAGIRWSSTQTLRETEARMDAHGISSSRLVTLMDVDTAADLQQLRIDLRNSPPQIAPLTRKWLDENP